MEENNYEYLLNQNGLEILQYYKPVDAPFSYYGSKKRIAKKLLPLIPPHNAWIEAFCGSAAITLAKPPAPIEVINDLDDNIFNLFEQLRNNPEDLIKAIELTPYASKEYYLSVNNPVPNNPIEKARRFLILTMMTVNGAYGRSHSGFSRSQSYSRNYTEARVNRWNNIPERFEPIIKRLKSIRIENRNALDLIEVFRYRPASLLYLDPPYFARRKHKYAYDENNLVFHEKLLQFCNEANCMIILSGYESDLYYSQLSSNNGWKRVTIDTTTRGTNGADEYRKELVWLNSHAIKALKKGKVPITLSSKETQNNKINPERK